VEDYLKGLLKAIRPVEPTPVPIGVESNEEDTAVAALSRRKHIFLSIRVDVEN